MGTMKRTSPGAAIALLATGCILPLGLDVEVHDHGIRGSGHVVSQRYHVAGFDALTASGAARIVVERTEREAVTVTAETNILPDLRIEVVRGRLILGVQPGVSLSPTREVVFHVESRGLAQVVASGASYGEVNVHERLDADVSGAARLRFAGDPGLHVRVSGAGSARPY